MHGTKVGGRGGERERERERKYFEFRSPIVLSIAQLICECM